MSFVQNDRTQSRQIMVDQWFAEFVDNELYDQNDYHDFCKRVKGMTTFEIERSFKKEMSN